VEKARSLGKLERSTSSTLYPFRASKRAVAEPAQRAPTTTASYMRLSHQQSTEIRFFSLASMALSGWRILSQLLAGRVGVVGDPEVGYEIITSSECTSTRERSVSAGVSRL